eukprot:ctg_528.g253
MGGSEEQGEHIAMRAGRRGHRCESGAFGHQFPQRASSSPGRASRVVLAHPCDTTSRPVRRDGWAGSVNILTFLCTHPPAKHSVLAGRSTPHALVAAAVPVCACRGRRLRPSACAPRPGACPVRPRRPIDRPAAALPRWNGRCAHRAATASSEDVGRRVEQQTGLHGRRGGIRRADGGEPPEWSALANTSKVPRHRALFVGTAAPPAPLSLRRQRSHSVRVCSATYGTGGLQCERRQRAGGRRSEGAADPVGPGVHAQVVQAVLLVEEPAQDRLAHGVSGGVQQDRRRHEEGVPQPADSGGGRGAVALAVRSDRLLRRGGAGGVHRNRGAVAVASVGDHQRQAGCVGALRQRRPGRDRLQDLRARRREDARHVRGTAAQLRDGAGEFRSGRPRRSGAGRSTASRVAHRTGGVPAELVPVAERHRRRGRSGRQGGRGGGCRAERGGARAGSLVWCVPFRGGAATHQPLRGPDAKARKDTGIYRSIDALCRSKDAYAPRLDDLGGVVVAAAVAAEQFLGVGVHILHRFVAVVDDHLQSSEIARAIRFGAAVTRSPRPAGRKTALADRAADRRRPRAAGAPPSGRRAPAPVRQTGNAGRATDTKRPQPHWPPAPRQSRRWRAARRGSPRNAPREHAAPVIGRLCRRASCPGGERAASRTAAYRRCNRSRAPADGHPNPNTLPPAGRIADAVAAGRGRPRSKTRCVVAETRRPRHCRPRRAGIPR